MHCAIFCCSWVLIQSWWQAAGPSTGEMLEKVQWMCAECVSDRWLSKLAFPTQSVLELDRALCHLLLRLLYWLRRDRSRTLQRHPQTGCRRWGPACSKVLHAGELSFFQLSVWWSWQTFLQSDPRDTHMYIMYIQKITVLHWMNKFAVTQLLQASIGIVPQGPALFAFASASHECWLYTMRCAIYCVATWVLIQSHRQASAGQPNQEKPQDEKVTTNVQRLCFHSLRARSISSCSLEFEWSLIAFPTIAAFCHADGWGAGSTLRFAFYLGNKTLQSVCFRSLACISKGVQVGICNMYNNYSVSIRIAPCFAPSTFAAGVLVRSRQEQDAAKASTNRMQEVRAQSMCSGFAGKCCTHGELSFSCQFDSLGKLSFNRTLVTSICTSCTSKKSQCYTEWTNLQSPSCCKQGTATWTSFGIVPKGPALVFWAMRCAIYSVRPRAENRGYDRRYYLSLRGLVPIQPPSSWNCTFKGWNWESSGYCDIWVGHLRDWEVTMGNRRLYFNDCPQISWHRSRTHTAVCINGWWCHFLVCVNLDLIRKPSQGHTETRTHIIHGRRNLMGWCKDDRCFLANGRHRVGGSCVTGWRLCALVLAGKRALWLLKTQISTKTCKVSWNCKNMPSCSGYNCYSEEKLSWLKTWRCWTSRFYDTGFLTLLYTGLPTISSSWNHFGGVCSWRFERFYIKDASQKRMRWCQNRWQNPQMVDMVLLIRGETTHHLGIVPSILVKWTTIWGLRHL